MYQLVIRIGPAKYNLRELKLKKKKTILQNNFRKSSSIFQRFANKNPNICFIFFIISKMHMIVLKSFVCIERGAPIQLPLQIWYMQMKGRLEYINHCKTSTVALNQLRIKHLTYTCIHFMYSLRTRVNHRKQGTSHPLLSLLFMI